MARTAEREFEVWGNPVEHSLSPALHEAAYRVLDVPWSYRYREVSQELITPAWVGVGANLAGISLTMPLKERVLDLVAPRDSIVDLLQAANTVYRSGETPVLSNTDPFGVDRALERFGVHAEHAWILGAGATARSVGYALGRRGTTDITLFVRDIHRAERTAFHLRNCGLTVGVQHFSALDRAMPPQLVASTLPGDAQPVPEIPPVVVGSAALFDVAYSPWPSHYANVWASSPHPVISGLWMLSYQALAQIRLFVNADVTQPLENEDAVFAAMCDAVGLSAE
jgi:Shikimate 5-dehydrogenase